MPAIQRSEFALALNQVASERGVDVDVVIDTVKNAILAAYRKDHAGVELEEFTAELNPNTGEAKILHNGEDVTPPGFGRIAAQTAKQVILQKIREKEKEAILSDYRVRVGTIVNGMILRFAGQNIIVDIGKTEALMPVSEQIPGERYHLNQRLSFYLVEIREGLKGEEIIVSRSSNGLIEGLFRREVPEVAQGSVQIKDIVREPGNRSKVAVYSNQSGIDPVGSCVGQKGVRVQAIIQEFSGMEKIDIIQWSDDPKTYISQSLSPAKNVRVEMDEKEKVAHVFVPPEELSLAIGKDGQNVRLASRLTGYRIEIEGKDELLVSQDSDGQTQVEATEKVSTGQGDKTDEKIETAAKTESTAEETGESPVEETPEQVTEVAVHKDAPVAEAVSSEAITSAEAGPKVAEEKSDATPVDGDSQASAPEDATEKTDDTKDSA